MMLEVVSCTDNTPCGTRLNELIETEYDTSQMVSMTSEIAYSQNLINLPNVTHI